MLHSFTSLGSRRERLLQRGGSCTCCRRWSHWSLHHTVRQKLHVSKGPEMPTTIPVRECYFLSFDAVFGDREKQSESYWNLHNMHRDSIHQFGMPWNKKTCGSKLKVSINSRLALNRDMPQPQPAIISSHSHVYSLVNIPPNHGKKPTFKHINTMGAMEWY